MSVFFGSSDEVTRAEWKSYVNNFQIETAYKGIQGLGYAAVLSQDEIPGIEQKAREEGISEFKVFPQGERDVYTAILYLTAAQ